MNINSNLIKYLNNGIWLFSDRLIKIFLSFFVGISVARYLGPAKFGLFSYSQGIVGIFSSFSSLGIDSIIVREFLNNKNVKTPVIGTIFWLKVLGSILTLFFISIFLINFNSIDKNEAKILICILSFSTLFQAFNVIDFYFQSKFLNKFIVKSNLISAFFSSITKLLLIYFKVDVFYFAIAILLDNVVLSIVYLYAYFIYENTLIDFFKFELKYSKYILSTTWPMLLSGIFLIIQAKVDQVMIRDLSGDFEAGLYGVALRLIEAFSFLPVILNILFMPILLKSKKISEEIYLNRYVNYNRLSFVLFLITAIPIYFLGEKIVPFLFGGQYYKSGILVSLMSLRLFFTNFGIVRNSFITIESLFKYSLLTLIIGSVLNIFLNFYFIRNFGAIGSIYSSSISFFISTIFMDLFYTKTKNNILVQITSIFSFYKLSFKYK